jgi:hypothetical protein
MVAKWVTGAENLVDERIAYAKANNLSPRVGDTYRLPDSPWRVVWHTVEAPEDDPDTPNADEGWELPQARAYIIRHRVPPHVWALPEHDWLGQTVPLDLSAYALVHRSGDPETNHRHAIQVEVLGYAKDGLDDPDLCDWLGRRVLRPVLEAGVPINLAHLAPSSGSDAYGLSGSVRQTWAWWANFDGLCGHQNVPGNVHWDPGVSNYARIAAAASTQEEPLQLDTDDQRFIKKAVRDDIHRLGQYLALGQGNQAFPGGPDSPWTAGITNPKLLAAINQIEGVDVDETALATALLAVLTPQAIADALDDEIATEVVDLLHARLAG